MKVYMVRKGFEDYECTPHNLKVFGDIDWAIRFVEEDIKKEIALHKERWPDGLFRVEHEKDKNKWISHGRFEAGDPEYQEEVWIIEEWDVC
jgi:hypothetical protein